MFVQVIEMLAPAGQIEALRKLVQEEYLPSIRSRPGFLTAHLLEQLDNRDETKLVIYWDTHASLEDANRTGVLAGSTTSIAARMPGLKVQRQSYLVNVKSDSGSLEG